MPHHRPNPQRIVAATNRRNEWVWFFLVAVSALMNLNVAVAQDRDPAIDPTIQRIILAAASGECESFHVGQVAKPSAWDRFHVFVWQYQNNAVDDKALYDRVGLKAFHIDRGAGREDVVRWASENERPYYVDHAAGKGILHLSKTTGREDFRQKGTLEVRPRSLITRESIAKLTATIDENVAVVRQGPAAAIALDDEVSLARFNSPIEVDGSPESIKLYQRWLAQRYGSIDLLNQQWGTDLANFDQIQPASFEQVRRLIATETFARWNLSPWMDWRQFMDTQFAASISHLVRHTHRRTSDIPIGIVGGQQPSAYGGFDYRKLAPAVQWIESYDIGATNELLVSFWNQSRKPIVQTFFSSGNADRDRWFLWYYWAHGNSAVIAWPEIGGKPWFDDSKVHPAVEALAETFSEIQSPRYNFLSDAKTRLMHDSVAILYSHPSVQASWATDALVHGRTWPRRSSSLDNACSSAGKNRVAWSKLVEDLSLQPRWITTDDLHSGTLIDEKTRCLILPRAMALSDESCQAIEDFVGHGGHVIADYWTAVLDDRGKARTDANGTLVGGLDALFGVKRNEDAGYFDGFGLTEVNGERFGEPFLQRLTTTRAFAPVERGTRSVQDNNQIEAQPTTIIQREHVGGGRTIYLNASPVPYFDNAWRQSSDGQAWRDTIGTLIQSRVRPKAVCQREGLPVPMTEVLHWRRGKEEANREDFFVIVSNPSRQAAVDGSGEVELAEGAGPISVRIRQPYQSATDLRTGQTFYAGQAITVEGSPSVATVIRVEGYQD